MAMFTKTTATAEVETFDLPVVEGYDCEVNGNMDACIEAFDDQLAVIEAMHALDIAEIEYSRKIQSLKESDAAEEEIKEVEDELEKVTEASIKDIFARIKEALLKLWAKVKAFFASIKKFFDALILNGKDFAKKYENEIKNVKPFKYERFEYTVMDTEKPSDILKRLSWADLNPKSMSIAEMDDAMTEMGEDSTDKCRALLLNKSGELSSDEFNKELYKKFRNGDDYKKTVDTHPNAFIDWLTSKSASTKSIISTFQTDMDTAFSNTMNKIKAAENSNNGATSEDGKLNRAQKTATLCSRINSCLAKYQTACGAYINAWKSAVKEYDGVAKAVCVRALVEKKRQAKEAK